MTAIEKKFRTSLKANNLVDRHDTVLLGVSGGPDSVAMLYLFCGLMREYKLRLHIAHLDHGWRRDSARDARYVRSLGAQLGVPVTVKRLRTRRGSLKGSLEEYARNERLCFLFGTARAVKADKIALGHNLDDQAETVLMRILRGTGLYGLAAIIPKRLMHGFTVIRPLLDMERREIESYVRRKKVRVCRDITNRMPVYRRNKIRGDLIPFLERRYSRNIKQLLAHLAESAGSDYDYLYQRVSSLMKPGQVSFRLDKLRHIHPALRRIMFREAVSRLKGSTRRMTFQHIREIEDLLYNRPVYSIVDLPLGVSCRKTKTVLNFFRRHD